MVVVVVAITLPFPIVLAYNAVLKNKANKKDHMSKIPSKSNMRDWYSQIIEFSSMSRNQRALKTWSILMLDM